MFHTEGEYIINEAGRTVKLTGAGFDASMIAQKYAAWNRDYHSDLMVQKGVKSIRIFICYGWWTGEYTDYSFPIDRDVYRSCIDRMIADFSEKGIYCWINMEGSYAKQQEWSLDSSNWISVLQEIALRYKDYPNMIGIEPQNEPNDWCWEDRYYTRVQEVAHGIHEVAPNLLIFVDTPIHGWVNFDANFPIAEPNVVYCYHMYYRWQSVVETYRAGNFAQAKAALEAGLVNSLYWLKEQGYPVMDTEFGVGRDEEFHPAFDVFLQDYFNIMKKYGIHWNYFHWDNDDRIASYDLWLEDWITPSPQGEIVFANLESLIPGPMHALSITSTPVTGIPFTIRRI